MDRKAATAIFLAVLGRMTEPTPAASNDDDVDRTAALMVLILRRALLRF